MSYPQNPDTIVIRNDYYPKGLREIDIWNYYQSVKTPLLKETIGKTLIVFFTVDTNKFIVMRKNKQGGLIRLNMRDYDSLISGRSISFHNVMNKYSSYGIIDVDTDDFKIAKELSVELNRFFYNQKYINGSEIVYTGKDSFHIRVHFNFDYKIDYIKQRITNALDEFYSNIDYTIKARREKNKPNLDLQRNILNAGHIALHSLSVDGLKCMEVEISKMKWFRKDFAKIKI
jgi:hypothetical protein